MAAEPAVESFDAVVVGSGFGGSVAACRLAEADRSVLLLERGRPYPPGSFPRTPRELGQAFWDPASGRYGMFDVWRFRRLDAVCASGLGGGSLIYANVMIRKDPETFVREDLSDHGRESWPIDFGDLERHYDRVEEMQAPQRYPDAAEPYASTPKAVAMREAASLLEAPVEAPKLAVLFAPAGGEDPVPGAPIPPGDLHGLPRSTCRLCGECDLGCNVGAKNTLDFTYLSAAQRRCARLRTCCEVRTI